MSENETLTLKLENLENVFDTDENSAFSGKKNIINSIKASDLSSSLKNKTSRPSSFSKQSIKNFNNDISSEDEIEQLKYATIYIYTIIFILDLKIRNYGKNLKKRF